MTNVPVNQLTDDEVIERFVSTQMGENMSQQAEILKDFLRQNMFLYTKQFGRNQRRGEELLLLAVDELMDEYRTMLVNEAKRAISISEMRLLLTFWEEHPEFAEKYRGLGRSEVTHVANFAQEWMAIQPNVISKIGRVLKRETDSGLVINTILSTPDV